MRAAGRARALGEGQPRGGGRGARGHELPPARSSVPDAVLWLEAVRAGHLQHFQEGGQIFALLICQPDIEPRVVEVDQVVDPVGYTSVEIRRPRRQAAEDRRLELTYVSDLTGGHRPPGVGGLHIAGVLSARRGGEWGGIADGPQAVLRQLLGAIEEAVDPRVLRRA